MLKYPIFSFLCVICTSFYGFADFYVPSYLNFSVFYELLEQGTVKNRTYLANNSTIPSGIKYKNTLYFVGQTDVDGPCLALWISDLSGNNVKIKIIEREQDSNIDLSATALIENDGKLFIVGKFFAKATLWICDLEGNVIKSFNLDQNSSESNAYKIITVKNKIYITGTVQSSPAVSTPTLWILDTNGNLINSRNLQTNPNITLAGPIICVSNKLYILASEGIGVISSKPYPLAVLKN
jgi:hypothetical protein